MAERESWITGGTFKSVADAANTATVIHEEKTMKTQQSLLLIIALMLCLPAFGTLIPGVVSTGTNTSGTPATDNYWTITACPGPCTPGFYAFLTDTSGFPFGAWLADDANSAWISPQSSYTSSQTDPPGGFEYELVFDLTGFNPATAVISFYVSVDNDLTDVLLNGASQSITYSSFASLSGLFTINSDFVPGSNTLTFLTNNGSGDTGNPNGLRVQIDSAEADLVPEPTTMALTGAGLLCLPLFLRRRRRS